MRCAAEVVVQGNNTPEDIGGMRFETKFGSFITQAVMIAVLVRKGLREHNKTGENYSEHHQHGQEFVSPLGAVQQD